MLYQWLQQEGKLDTISVQVVRNAIPDWQLTTKNGGMQIEVRKWRYGSKQQYQDASQTGTVQTASAASEVEPVAAGVTGPVITKIPATQKRSDPFVISQVSTYTNIPLLLRQNPDYLKRLSFKLVEPECLMSEEATAFFGNFDINRVVVGAKGFHD